MILIENELDLLKQLKAAGEHGRTIRTFDTRLRLDRLVVAGYVASQATGLDLVHYKSPNTVRAPSVTPRA